MHDKIVSFVEKHRVLSIIIIVFVAIFLVLCIMRAVNKSKKGSDTVVDNQVVATEAPVVTEEPVKEESSYQSQLSIKAKEEEEEEARAQARLAELEKRRAAEEEKKRLEEAMKNQKPTYGDEVICWKKDGVPDSMVDGSSVKAYLNSVSLSDFGTKWGKKLNAKDKFTTDFYMIGVDQNPKDKVVGYDNQSTGWLISNFDKIPDNAAIKFTDLNTIGSLTNSSHVAVLCSYDWYSAFGMDDTLVVFEDISGKLKKSNFKAGQIFSCIVYKHNMKIKSVNGQKVVCIQYNTFK